MLSEADLDCWEREAQAAGSPDSERTLALLGEVRRLRELVGGVGPRVQGLSDRYVGAVRGWAEVEQEAQGLRRGLRGALTPSLN